MNPVLEVIANRRSVRAYADQPITTEEKEAILQAAFRAPTAGNMMLYSILEVDDPTLKERLTVTCDNQPFIARAPLVLLFLADYQRWFDYFTHCRVEQRCQELGLTYRTPQEGDLMLACCDTLIAAQNAVIAAESMGIGSCYIGDILERYEIHQELFSLPKYVVPVTLVCFGHPTPGQQTRPQTPRFDKEFIVHKNAYHPLGDNAMEQMFLPTQERYFSTGRYYEGAENIGQHYYLRKFISEFSVEMSRSVREILKNWS